MLTRNIQMDFTLHLKTNLLSFIKVSEQYTAMIIALIFCKCHGIAKRMQAKTDIVGMRRDKIFWYVLAGPLYESSGCLLCSDF